MNIFKKVMSEKTDQELINIVTILKRDYQPEAVSSAIEEIDKRNIDSREIDSINEKLEEEEIRLEKEKNPVITDFNEEEIKELKKVSNDNMTTGILLIFGGFFIIFIGSVSDTIPVLRLFGWAIIYGFYKLYKGINGWPSKYIPD